MSTFPPIKVDGDFTYPREIEGSPVISTDDVTGAKLITRRYVVLTANYKPLPQAQKDPVFKDAYLVNENMDQVIGVLTFFSRNYAQLPATRTEPRRLAFTMPGKSAVEISEISGRPVGWNPYGLAAPYTRDITGTAVISYEINPTVVVEEISKITFKGAPVDFVGPVYEFVGNVEVPRPGGIVITEPRFRYVGLTFPVAVVGIWVAEVGLQRWRGPIWEKTVISVNTFWLRG
jgi:hypothetical protein